MRTLSGFWAGTSCHHVGIVLCDWKIPALFSGGPSTAGPKGVLKEPLCTTSTCPGNTTSNRGSTPTCPGNATTLPMSNPGVGGSFPGQFRPQGVQEIKMTRQPACTARQVGSQLLPSLSCYHAIYKARLKASDAGVLRAASHWRRTTSHKSPPSTEPTNPGKSRTPTGLLIVHFPKVR